MQAFRIASLWPGLAGAWYRGQVRGLAFAVVFAWCLCFLLLVTFVWPSWFSGWIVATVWLLLGSFWLYEAVRCQFVITDLLEDVASDSEQEFIQAQKEYLQGNWFDAEARLLRITEHKPHDAAAMLLLIGVLRHTHRIRPALRKLEQLELLDAATPWQFEIHRERELLEKAISESANSSDTDLETAESLESPTSGK
jgi:hypothetical protein